MAVTDDQGWATFSLRSRLSGEYESTVTNASLEDWVYDESANEVNSQTLIVP
jgi:hypothetical protein